MADVTKKEVVSNEIVVKIGDKKVSLIKNSNTYKVGEELKYLKQIVWDEATEEILKEIEEELKK